MSAIIPIFNAIAAKPVTVNSITPTVYGLGVLPDAVSPAQLPCRLLLPIGSKTAVTAGQFLGFGTAVTINWRVTDLMLWATAVAGAGIHDYAQTLVQYAGVYVDMLRTIRAPAPITRLTNWQILPGRFQYPLNSGRWFFGVECTIDLQELLSGA